MVSVNWLLNDQPLSVKDALILELTDDLLVGTSAATLRKALTDSGLGESVIGGGLSSELLQNTFSIGLKVRSLEVCLKGCLPKNHLRGGRLAVHTSVADGVVVYVCVCGTLWQSGGKGGNSQVCWLCRYQGAKSIDCFPERLRFLSAVRICVKCSLLIFQVT